MTIEIRRLRTFVAIAEHGGFTAAGQTLGLTQSAISNQMRSLEADLRTELFDRSKRPPLLNARGIGILPGVRTILKAYAELGGLPRPKVAPTGTIRIASTATPLISLVPALLVMLEAEAPQLRAVVTSGMSDDICHRVGQGELDGGIVTDLGTLPVGLSCIPIRRDHLIGIAPGDSPATSFTEALDLHPFIRVSGKTWTAHLIESHLSAEQLARTDAFELDSFEAIVEMVRLGLGCAVVSSDALARLACAQVRPLAFAQAPVFRTIGFVERTPLSTSPRAMLLRAMVGRLESAQRQPQGAAVHLSGGGISA